MTDPAHSLPDQLGLWLEQETPAPAHTAVRRHNPPPREPGMPIRKEKRDWFRILRDLMEAGVSMSRVARTCGRDDKTVTGWAEGSEPRDSDARVVLSLYARFCPALYLDHERSFRIPVPVTGEKET